MTGILQSLLGSVSSAAASATDAYFNLVTLLLPGNGTNGAQNNTFLDSSTNNFTITRNGNTTQGTFSPFSQTGWGNYFNGSSDYLTVADNAALDLGTGNFTIEAWIFATSVSPATNFTIVAKGGSSATGTWQFDITSGSKLRLQYDTAGAITSTASLVANTWNHVVAVREGTGSNQTKIYINGTNDGTGTVSSDLSDASTVKIGLNRDGTTYFPGYISNLRIVKGTAVYTSAFTPPTSALTAITNTSLLTCQSNRFVDNSSNAFTITANGTPSVQAFSPFAPTAAYDTAVVGGSGYFDGAGDVLTVASNTAFDFAGNATIELWIYFTANMGVRQDIVHHASNGFEILKLSGDTIYCGFGGGTITSSITVKANQWYHIALVRSSTGASGLNLYINGANVGSATAASSVTSGTMAIGAQASGTNPVSGYISGYRIVKGTAVYTAAFTPPTAPLTAISGTSLLLSCTNAGITDATAKNDLETVGNAQISTTQSKFGGSSMYFDGTGDYLVAPAGPGFDFGTGDFTIEMWIYPNTVSSLGVLYDQWAAGSGSFVAGQLQIQLSSTAKINFDIASGPSTNQRLTTTTSITVSTWTHIAIVRSGTGTGNIKVYINGTADATTITHTTQAGLSTRTPALGVELRTGAGTYYNGYIDDFRITKGYARYTGNFTAPTAAFALQ